MRIREQQMHVLFFSGKRFVKRYSANGIGAAKFSARQIDADNDGIRSCGLSPQVQSPSFSRADFEDTLRLKMHHLLIEPFDFQQVLPGFD